MMTTMPESPITDSQTLAVQSSYQARSFRLTGPQFLSVLVLLVALPVATVATIARFLPATQEGKLEAQVKAIGLPAPEYYQVQYQYRDPHLGGELLVTNKSDQKWTHLNITINNAYQIIEIEPILAGQTASFELNRFVSRSGARFSLQYNELRNVMIYARRETKDRATFYQEFDTVEKGTRN